MDGVNDASYLTTGQVAARLGISKPTLLRAVHRGAIRPSYRTPGGYLRFRASTVETYARALSTHPGLRTVG